MVMISLLDLPLDLPPDAPVRQEGMETFLDGLPEYLSRCKPPRLSDDGQSDRRQASLLKAASPGVPGPRRMARMRSVP
jgi:hypothetical protein